MEVELAKRDCHGKDGQEKLIRPVDDKLIEFFVARRACKFILPAK
jgi:hypothetical protein